MRSMVFATVATVGLALGTGAMAQTTNGAMAPPMGPTRVHPPGSGASEPASTQAGNIAPGDTRSTIAPRLPGSEGRGIDTTARQELRMAERDLRARRTAAAQEALERAETRLLDRSTPQGMTDVASGDPLTRTIAQAREALGRNDIAGARSLVARALAQTGAG